MTRWKAIGWTVAFFVAGIALTVGVNVGLTGIFPTIDRLWAGVIAQIVGFGAASWGIGGGALRWGWKDLRYVDVGDPVRGAGVGFALGAVPAFLAMVIAAPAGGAGWSLDGGSMVSWAKAIGGLALLLVPAAYSEELIFRGVGYVALGRAFGKLGPAVVLSVLFATAHVGNPNVSGLGLVNVGLAGVWLSAAFWLPGGIWAATGTHVGWNLTLAALGAPVSGLAFTLPMLDYATGGPSWLTGGAFGPEGGVIATVVVGVATVVLMRWIRREEQAASS